jgi:hypothetical protein
VQTSDVERTAVKRSSVRGTRSLRRRVVLAVGVGSTPRILKGASLRTIGISEAAATKIDLLEPDACKIDRMSN